MNHLLYVLSHWTRTFPYDFRQTEMISQLEDLFKKMCTYESTLQSPIQHIQKKLRSKVTLSLSLSLVTRTPEKRTVSLAQSFRSV